ncbi:MAG: hypothetical protein FJY88_13470 [Candidatus Eisenbacteria bacterium]|nr:hypothetical protein [Candidatus Eisenbacteria bacterium]
MLPPKIPSEWPRGRRVIALGLAGLGALFLVFGAGAARAPDEASAGARTAAEDLRPGGGIDSLAPLPSWAPRDEAAGVRLSPHAMAVDPLGRLWLLDKARARVLLLDGADGRGRSFSAAGRQRDAALSVSDLAVSGSFLFLLEPSAPSLILVDLDGNLRERIDLSAAIEQAGDRGFLPARLLVGRSGDLWLLDARGFRILHFDRRGLFVDAPLDVIDGEDRPARVADVAPTRDDGILLLDPERAGLIEIDPYGGLRAIQDLGEALREPASLAIDRDDNRYILEAGGRLRILDRAGVLLWTGELPGAQGWSGPNRIAVAGDGILHRGDSASGRIDRWRIVRTPREDAQR